jgi:tetratricopeptide (TPR) repeat protein
MAYDGPEAKPFRQDLLAALKRWHKDSLGQTELAALPSINRRLAGSPEMERATAVRQVLRQALDELRFSGQPQEASLLEERFVQRKTVAQMCEEHSVAERTFHYRQDTAVDALAHVLWTLEFGHPDLGRPVPKASSRPPAAPVPTPRTLTAHLPPPSYSQLFGVEDIVARLYQRLADPADHWLVSVEGIGGLGKTAVAREAAGRLHEASRFAGIAWVTAKQEFYSFRGLTQSDFPALTFEQLMDSIVDQLDSDAAPNLVGRAKQERARSLLQSRPYLVVVDNFDAIHECGSLLDQLWDLANPAKFLLTSRIQVAPCTSGWVTISTVSLNFLAEPDAAALLRYEAQLRGLHRIAESSDEKLQPILSATGGHALAIKLAVGQLVSLPLGRVLNNLEPGSRTADPLYEYIYRPSWELLSPRARRVIVLLALMPASGGRWEDLAGMSGLPDAELDAALGELIARSLISVTEAEDTIYTLHSLTRRFVSSQAEEWKTLRDGAERVGEYYAAYAREHADNWAMLTRRQEHILRAIELCIASGPKGRRTAIQCVRLLGRFIKSRGNLTTWLSYLDMAVEAAAELGDDAAQADLWNQKGMLIGREGDLKQVLPLHKRAAAVFERLGDRLNQARTLRLIGNVHYTRAERPQALACYEQALHLLGQLPVPEPRDMALIYNNIAGIYGGNQDWPRALTYFERALAYIDPERDRDYITPVLTNIGEVCFEMGRWQEGVAWLERALPLQEESGDVFGQAASHHFLSVCYAGLEDWDRVRDHGRQAVQLFALLDLANSRAHVCTDLASVYAEVGEIETARGYLEVAEPLWRRLGSVYGIFRVRVIEGDLFAQEKRWSSAELAYREALMLIDDQPDHQAFRFAALLGLATLRLRTGDHPGAAHHLEQAQDVAAAWHRPDLTVRALWLRAELDGAQGRPALQAALALCAEQDGSNDRLNRLGRQTQTRLNAWDAQYG